MAGPNVICETGKRTYFKERLANRAITEAVKRGELPQLKHYQCPSCGYWHLARKRPMATVFHEGPAPSQDAS